MSSKKTTPFQAQYALVGDSLVPVFERNRELVTHLGVAIDSATTLFTTPRAVESTLRRLNKVANLNVVKYTPAFETEFRTDPRNKFRMFEDHLAHLLLTVVPLKQRAAELPRITAEAHQVGREIAKNEVARAKLAA